MSFTLKQKLNSKCQSCVHAHIVQKEVNGEITICRMMGMQVGVIKECNQHMPHIYAPIPVHMAMNAWLIESKKDDRKSVGFKPPKKINENPSIPIPFEDIMQEMEQEGV